LAGDHVREILTHTKRRDFQNCRRYFYHRHEQRLQPRMLKGGRRRGTAFGNAIFAALRDKEESEHTSGEATFSLEDIVGIAIEDAYSEVHPRDQDEADEIELEKVKLTIVCAGYVERYRMRARREIEFYLPFKNPDTHGHSKSFKLGGKIDGIEVVGQKRGRVIEDKLVGQIQQPMIERLPLDAQATEYVDALIHHGWQAEVAYRHTLFPQSKPKLIGTGKARRRETLLEYGMRLSDDVHERPEHYFDEQILAFPTDHLEDYRRGRWGIGKQILQARSDAKQLGWQGAYPMNPSRCWEYGGCEFIPLCTKQIGARDLYIVVSDTPELGGEYGGATSEYPTSATA
jgi:hypothetical protein